MQRLTPEQTRLVEDHLHLAEHQAHVAKWRWSAADPSALLSDAMLGLIDAACKWNPDDEMTFVGYARYLIRYQIIDGFRATRGRSKHRPYFLSLDAVVNRELDDPRDADAQMLAAEDHEIEHVLDAVHAAATVAGLELSERERYVIVQLGSGRTLRDIGVDLGVSEARVCQIRSAVRKRVA